jgi:putative transposase
VRRRYQGFICLNPDLTEQRTLREIAVAYEIPFRTAQRWVEHYQKFGLAGLARRARGDRGVRRAVSAKVREAIEGLALERPPLPASSIHRQVCQFAKLAGEPSPSYWKFST